MTYRFKKRYRAPLHKEEIEDYLNSNSCRESKDVILYLFKKWDITEEQAEKIYKEWRRRYVTGETGEIKIQWDLNSFAAAYSKKNKAGLTKVEIIFLLREIVKNGLSETARIYDIDKNIIKTLYENAKEKGVVIKGELVD